MEFDGRAAIVTGGASGIGEEIALAFARARARVMIFDMDNENAKRVCSLISDGGGEAACSVGDVSKEADVQAMVEQTLHRFGSVHVLVNNAGIGGGELVEDMQPKQWSRVMEVNLAGAFLCCRAVLSYMKKQRFGKIVNISSTAGVRMGFWGGAHYAASKAGLLAFTRHLAFELAPFGINVNAVLPGFTDTPLLAKGPGNAAETSRRLIPMGRLVKPGEIADAVLFLCGDEAGMITGVSMPVDGGSLLGWTDTETYFKMHTGRENH